MKVSRKTLELDVETRRKRLVRRRTWKGVLCPTCGHSSETASPETAAEIAGVSIRAVFRMIESGNVHFEETANGKVLVCMATLRRELEEILGPEAGENGGGK